MYILGDDEIIIALSLDDVNYHQKPTKDVRAITKRIAGKIQTLGLHEIAKYTVQPYGRCFCPAVFSDGKRSNNTWVRQQLFGLDFDDGITVEAVLERCENYGILPCFIYSTFSNTEEHPKFRVFFCNESEVTDFRVRTVLQLGLMKLFPESDKSCKDASRIFFGGQKLLYEDYQTRINVVDLVRELCRYIGDTDSPHATREIKSYCQSVGLDMFNGLPKILACAKDDVEEISKIGEIEGVPIDNVYIGVHTKSPKNDTLEENLILPLLSSTLILKVREEFYEIFFCSTNVSSKGSDKSPRKYKVVNEKLERKLTEHFPFEELEKECQLWKDFSEETYRLDHDERMGIATNLLWAKGGRKKFFEALSKGDFDVNKWEYDCNYFVKMNYLPMRCERFCRFADECEHTKNMIEQVKLPKGQVREITTPNVKPLEQAEKELREHFKRALEATENKIYVIKAPTGIGKTELYTSLKNVTIALPTHKLKDEVAERMKIPFTATPKLPDNERIKYLYSVGSYMMANQYIRKLAKEGNQEYIDYLAKAKTANNAFGTILTTHDKVLSLKHRNDTIIIDEDIITTLLPVNTTTLKDLETMADKCGYFDTQHTLESIKNYAKNAGDGLIYEMPSFGGIKTSRLEELVLNNKINTNILGFLNCSHFVRYTIEGTGEVIINFINKRELSEKQKIIMMSATANEYICKLMFGDRLEFIDIGSVETKGNIQQYPQRSFTRYQMDKDSRVKKLAKALTKGTPVITFKRYQDDFDCIATFGATAGLDVFGGKDIAVIGTPHVNPTVYLLYANALGKKPRLNDINTKNSTKYVKIKRNNFEFYFNTYSNNDILQEIQLYLIESELLQAVGRARILRNDCTVTVLSNLPIQGAKFMYLTKDELEKLSA